MTGFFECPKAEWFIIRLIIGGPINGGLIIGPINGGLIIVYHWESLTQEGFGNQQALNRAHKS